MFRDLKKHTRFGGGGGGGSSAILFLFRDLKTSFSVNGALLKKNYFPEGGARAPPGSATDHSRPRVSLDCQKRCRSCLCSKLPATRSVGLNPSLLVASCSF